MWDFNCKQARDFYFCFCISRRPIVNIRYIHSVFIGTFFISSSQVYLHCDLLESRQCEHSRCHAGKLWHVFIASHGRETGIHVSNNRMIACVWWIMNINGKMCAWLEQNILSLSFHFVPYLSTSSSLPCRLRIICIADDTKQYQPRPILSILDMTHSVAHHSTIAPSPVRIDTISKAENNNRRCGEHRLARP